MYKLLKLFWATQVFIILKVIFAKLGTIYHPLKHVAADSENQP